MNRKVPEILLEILGCAKMLWDEAGYQTPVLTVLFTTTFIPRGTTSLSKAESSISWSSRIHLIMNVFHTPSFSITLLYLSGCLIHLYISHCLPYELPLFHSLSFKHFVFVCATPPPPSDLPTSPCYAFMPFWAAFLFTYWQLLTHSVILQLLNVLQFSTQSLRKNHYLSLISIAPHSPLPVCRSAYFHLWRKAYCNHNPPKYLYAYFAGTWTNKYPHLMIHITKSRDPTFPQSKLKDGSILSYCCATLNYIFTQQKSSCEYVTLSTYD